MKTLIVEDDVSSQDLLQALLSKYGECQIASTGREAVQAFRAAAEAGQGFDLVCMDILLPEMDGQTALRRIRALEEARGVMPDASVKVIMTSALGDIAEVMRAFHGLCDDYLVKPIDAARLFGHLKSCGLVS